MGTFLSERIVNYRCFIAGHGNRYSTLGASNNNRSTHTIDFHLSSHELLRIAIVAVLVYRVTTNIAAANGTGIIAEHRQPTCAQALAYKVGTVIGCSISEDGVALRISAAFATAGRMIQRISDCNVGIVLDRNVGVGCSFNIRLHYITDFSSVIIPVSFIPIGVTGNLFYLNFCSISKLSPVSRRFAWRLSAIQSSAADDIAALIAQIQQYPELGKILSDVLAKQTSADENTENGNGNLSDSE